VHCAHELEAARFEIDGGGSVVKGFNERKSVCALVDGPVGEVDAESLGPRRTIVLFVKQVHLQNVGAAVNICQ
jgi:hypothetical protein